MIQPPVNSLKLGQFEMSGGTWPLSSVWIFSRNSQWCSCGTDVKRAPGMRTWPVPFEIWSQANFSSAHHFFTASSITGSALLLAPYSGPLVTANRYAAAIPAIQIWPWPTVNISPPSAANV
jgi:hypothetical protein